MPAKVFFDTSILVYVAIRDDPRSQLAEGLALRGGAISVQVLNEMAAVLRRKYRRGWDEIRETLVDIRYLCGRPQSLTAEVHESAIAIAQRYGFHFYDSLIVASALEAGCSTLYTEDLQHNQQIEELQVVNPFLISQTN